MDKTLKNMIWLVLSLIVILIVFTHSGVGQMFSFSKIQNSAQMLKQQVHSNYLMSILVFTLVYIFVNLWFPAAAVLNLLGGYLFGVLAGVFFVDLAATAGALVLFMISRKLASFKIQQKWKYQLAGFNAEIERNGDIYLISIRLIPMMPYLLINFLAGLTKVKATTFAWTTAVGSLPGIIIFCFAGKQILSLQSMNDVLTPKTMGVFALLAVFIAVSPYFPNKCVQKSKDLLV